VPYFQYGPRLINTVIASYASHSWRFTYILASFFVEVCLIMLHQ